MARTGSITTCAIPTLRNNRRSLEENYRLQFGPISRRLKTGASSTLAAAAAICCGICWAQDTLTWPESTPARIRLNTAETTACRWERDNALEFLARTTSWDLVFATDVIEHLGKDEIIAFLEAIHRALKPGGVVVLKTGNASSIYGSTMRYIDFTHEMSFTD